MSSVEQSRQEGNALATHRFVVACGVVGVIGLALSVIGVVTANRDQFFRSYLTAYTLWVGLSLGSMGIVFIQFLTGGNWGLATRRIFEAASATTPLMAVLFVPLLFGIPSLYSWALPADVAADPVLQHKALYLNISFFVVRTIFYLAVWIVLALLLRRFSVAADLRALQKLSIVGAASLGLTVSFAAIDWLMSLDADWYSTMYPPLVAMGFVLFAFAFGIVVIVFLAPRTPLQELVNPRLLNDLGSLLLAFLMLWGYMQYFEYLLIWAGNLTDEIPWYLRRIDGNWQQVAISLAAFGFGLPFWFLLFRPLKRNPVTLACIAGWLMLMHLVDVYWLVEPPFSPAGPSLSWLDGATLIGIGGVWLAVFAWQLGRRPLLAPGDPRLVRAFAEVAHEPA